MRGHVCRFIICLVLGVITTVAVAWYCAILGRQCSHDFVASGFTSSDDSGWAVKSYSRPGLCIAEGLPIAEVVKGRGSFDVEGHRLIDPQTPLLWFFTDGEHPEQGLQWVTIVVSAGWPVTALWYEVPEELLANQKGLTNRLDRGCLIAWVSEVPPANTSTGNVVAIPFRPLWKGLAIDAGFYGLLWLFLLTVRRTIKRRVPILSARSLVAAGVICGFLGTLTTIGVAWSFALCVNEQFSPFGPDDGYGETALGPDVFQRRSWRIYRDREPGALRLRSVLSAVAARTGPSPDGSAADFVPSWADYLKPSNDYLTYRILDARGWPMLAMWGGFEVPQHVEKGRYVGTLGQSTHAIVLPRYWGHEFRADWARVIPLAPIWTGFIVDSVCYGAAWLVILYVLAGPGLIRRTLRHRRGLCIACGYDLRGKFAEGCPECGWRRAEPAHS